MQISQLKLSFKTAKALRGRAEMLPKGPPWKSKAIPAIPNYPTKQPMVLYYRDTLDCLQRLFGNPLFAGRIDFHPCRLYTAADRLVRIYSEWMTGDGAWEMQVSILIIRL